MEDLIKQLAELQDAFLKMARETTGPDPVAFSYNAFKISEVCRKSAEGLKRNIPQQMEMEGGGMCWFNVCPECHGGIDACDSFCRHCGQAVK